MAEVPQEEELQELEGLLRQAFVPPAPAKPKEVGLSSTLQSLLRGVVSGSAEQVQAAMATALHPQPPECAELEEEVRCLEHQNAAATELLDRVEAQVGHMASSLQDKRAALRALSAGDADGRPGQLSVLPFPLEDCMCPRAAAFPARGQAQHPSAELRPAMRARLEALERELDSTQREAEAVAREHTSEIAVLRRELGALRSSKDEALAVSPRGAVALSFEAARPTWRGGAGALTRLAMARGGSPDRLVLSLALSGWACEVRRLRAPSRLLRLWAAGGGSLDLGAWLSFWRCVARESALRREASLHWAVLRFGCAEPSLLRDALHAWWLAARQSSLSAVSGFPGDAPGPSGNGEAGLTEARPDAVEFNIVIDNTVGQTLGVDTDTTDGVTLQIDAVIGGLFQQWNDNHPKLAVRPRDRIVEVNGIRNDVIQLVEECKQHKTLEMVVKRQAEPSGELEDLRRELAQLRQAPDLDPDPDPELEDLRRELAQLRQDGVPSERLVEAAERAICSFAERLGVCRAVCAAPAAPRRRRCFPVL